MSHKVDPVEQQFRVERAKRAADVRWAKARIEQRLWKIAEGYVAANPKLTREAAFTQAITANPEIYLAYLKACERTPTITAAEMEEAYQKEIENICALGDAPEMALHFIRNRVAPKDAMAYLLERKGR